jgi:outer membrane protein TolC
MLRFTAALLAFAAAVFAEVRPMTMRQAVETALKQNSDTALARLDEEKARQGVRLARDPFIPQIGVGSGLAYSNGFPMSIEGSAPSIVQAQATQYLFNRPQMYAIAQAKENAKGAATAVTAAQDEIAYRTAALYLDAERAARVGELARKDAESLTRVLEAVQTQVKEGRALPLAAKQAEFSAAQARAAAEALADEQATAETALALVLGFGAEDRVRPAVETRPAPAIPESEALAISAALESNKQLKQLESQVAAKELQMKGEKAARLPRADLVAQYAVLGRFNNYDRFYNAFQRNNGQIGVSLQLPILPGPGISARVAQTTSDVARLKIEQRNVRNRLSADLQAAFRDIRKADTAAEVARLDLEAARERLSVALAQMQEGRVSLRDVEEARVVENGKWMAFYDAQYAAEKAKWNVLRLTGGLTAEVRK